jgi:acetate kinase
VPLYVLFGGGWPFGQALGVGLGGQVKEEIGLKILVLNSGSSSLKYKLFDMVHRSEIASGLVERIGMADVVGRLVHKVPGMDAFIVEQPMPNHRIALKLVLDTLVDSDRGVIESLDEIAAVGHRVLHGKDAFKESVIVDNEILATLKSFIDLGPLHMPANTMGIESCMSLMEGVPQVAVFDTAFHQTMPKKAYLYAVPRKLSDEFGVRRYGFHGTSHRYVSRRTAEILGKPLESLKMITMHLGNGSSAAAIKDGKVIDTSMGFTPLEGFVMGTRCGDMDPAIVPYIQQKLGLSSAEVDNYMNKQCGLLGMSGVSSDMREIQKAIEEGNEFAKDAYDVFIYRLIKYVGAYFAAMGGLDVLVFTAGIGENDWLVRRHVCEGLAAFGVKIDVAKNEGLRGKEETLSTPDSKVQVLLVPTNEELMIAMDAYDLVKDR